MERLAEDLKSLLEPICPKPTPVLTRDGIDCYDICTTPAAWAIQLGLHPISTIQEQMLTYISRLPEEPTSPPTPPPTPEIFPRTSSPLSDSSSQLTLIDSDDDLSSFSASIHNDRHDMVISSFGWYPDQNEDDEEDALEPFPPFIDVYDSSTPWALLFPATYFPTFPSSSSSPTDAHSRLHDYLPLWTPLPQWSEYPEPDPFDPSISEPFVPIELVDYDFGDEEGEEEEEEEMRGRERGRGRGCVII